MVVKALALYFRRGDGVAERARLEIACGSKAHRGFESPPLRQFFSVKGRFALSCESAFSYGTTPLFANASSSGFNWCVSRSDVRPNSNLVSAKSVEDETIKVTNLDIFEPYFNNNLDLGGGLGL